MAWPSDLPRVSEGPPATPAAAGLPRDQPIPRHSGAPQASTARLAGHAQLVSGKVRQSKRPQVAEPTFLTMIKEMGSRPTAC